MISKKKTRPGRPKVTSLVSEADKMEHAIRLTKFGFKSTIISSVSGIGFDRIRKLWKEIHGVSSPVGNNPESYNLLETHKQVINCSLFLKVYIKLGGDNVMINIDFDKLMESAELYKLLLDKTDLEKPPLNPNEMFVLARDLRCDIISVHTCPNCGMFYVHNDASKIANNCPIGAIYPDRCSAGPLPFSKTPKSRQKNHSQNEFGQSPNDIDQIIDGIFDTFSLMDGHVPGSRSIPYTLNSEDVIKGKIT